MTLAEKLDIARTTFAFISTLALVIAVLQFRLQQRVWKTAHERSRAEKAIEVIRNFNDKLSVTSAATNKLIEGFTVDQLKDLDHGRPFSAPANHLNDLQAVFPGTSLALVEGEVRLTSEQVYTLRFEALEVLNAIEIVCQAWHLDVADRATLKSEIEFLYDPSLPDPTTFQEKFRNVFGGKRFYPALYAFIEHIEEERRKPTTQPRHIAPRP